MFWLMNSRQPALFLLAIIGALAVCQPSMYALLPSLFAAQFPAEVRCSGVSLCFQIAAAIGGVVAPLAATWLLARFGTTLPIAAYLVALGLLAAICSLSMRPSRAPRSMGQPESTCRDATSSHLAHTEILISHDDAARGARGPLE